jgi:prepilin-type N-terminal cleavage/methylation domain-containing protein
MLLDRESDNMKRAFTLVEMIAVLIVLGILILVIIPVMSGLLFDFEEKSNVQVYEQLYKASELSYAEKRTDDDFVFNDFWQEPSVFVNMDIEEESLYAKTWDEEGVIADSLFDKWSCTEALALVEDGYLKQKIYTDVKNRLELVNEDIVNVLMFAEENPSNNRLVIKHKAIYVGEC